MSLGEQMYMLRQTCAKRNLRPACWYLGILTVVSLRQDHPDTFGHVEEQTIMGIPYKVVSDDYHVDLSVKL